MIFITGGIAQGKSHFAASFHLPVIDDLEQRIREWLTQGVVIDEALAAHLTQTTQTNPTKQVPQTKQTRQTTKTLQTAQTTQISPLLAPTAKVQRLAPTDCVIVCAEIGCGIVPLAKEERIWREVVGRTACRLAAEADAVYQMNAGIAVQLK